jgi:hypothetical protein
MDNNILGVLIAVFKFIESNNIKTVADVELFLEDRKVGDGSECHTQLGISEESLGRYLKDNEIETQLEWDNHAEEVSKCLMYDDIDNFADIRYALDKIEEYKSYLNGIYHSLDDLVSTAEGIRDDADI